MHYQAPNVLGIAALLGHPLLGSESIGWEVLRISPILLSTGSAPSDMDDASDDASFRLLSASYILSVSRKLVVSVKVTPLLLDTVAISHSFPDQFLSF